MMNETITMRLPELHFSVPEFVLFFFAIGVAVYVLRLHVPTWVWFAFDILFALFWLALVLGDGPTLLRIFCTVIGAAGAAHMWWRDLRVGQP